MSTQRNKFKAFPFMILRYLIFVFLVPGFPGFALSQEYPTQPITLVVGMSPGGMVDIATRTLANEAKKLLKVEFLVVNKPGANHTVAMSYVISKRPDGYTLGSGACTVYTMAPHLLTLSFDPLKETDPIICYGTNRNVVIVRADSPFKTFKEVIDFAKENPMKVTLGHAGFGTSTHMNLGGMAHQMGVKISWVPCSGDSEAITSVLGGHIMAAAVSKGAFLMPHIKTNKVRVLAVVEGDDRLESLPEIPTLYELGYKDASPPLLRLIYGPKGLSDSIVKKLMDTFSRASETAEFKKFAMENDIQPMKKNNHGPELKNLLTTVYKNNEILAKKLELVKKPSK
jgi:tripartite-type tricarboxylate transporter receptor subunit TctC